MNPDQSAKEIFAVIGSKEKIHSSECCMTRLRLELDSLSDDKLAALKKINGVLGVNQTESELQIILGPGRAAEVTKCFQELLKASDSKASETKSAPSFGDGRELHAKIRAKNATPVKLFFKRVADIYTSYSLVHRLRTNYRISKYSSETLPGGRFLFFNTSFENCRKHDFLRA